MFLNLLYFIFCMGGVGYAGYALYHLVYKKDETHSAPEEIDVNNLSGLNLYNVYAKVKRFTSCKASIFLIAMADRGYIKIRDDGKELYIDKSVDYDSIEPKSRELMHTLFDGQHSTYADENSIMPVTTVRWINVSQKFRNVISKRLDEYSRSNKNNKEKDSQPANKKPWLLEIGVPMFILWAIWALAFGVSAKISDASNGLMAYIVGVEMMTGVFITIGLVGISIFRAFASDVSNGIERIEEEKSKAVKFFGGVRLGFIIMIMIIVVCAGFFSVFFYCVFVVVIAEATIFMHINLVLCILGVLWCLAFILIKDRGVKRKINPKVSDYIHLGLAANKIDKMALSEADVSNLFLASYMLERRDILEKLSHKMNDYQEWYIGDNWEGVEGTIKRLDEDDK